MQLLSNNKLNYDYNLLVRRHRTWSWNSLCKCKEIARLFCIRYKRLGKGCKMNRKGIQRVYNEHQELQVIRNHVSVSGAVKKEWETGRGGKKTDYGSSGLLFTKRTAIKNLLNYLFPNMTVRRHWSIHASSKDAPVCHYWTQVGTSTTGTGCTISTSRLKSWSAGSETAKTAKIAFLVLRLSSFLPHVPLSLGGSYTAVSFRKQWQSSSGKDCLLYIHGRQWCFSLRLKNLVTEAKKKFSQAKHLLLLFGTTAVVSFHAPFCYAHT